MNVNILDIGNARSYKTEANLLAALATFGLAEVPRLVVCNREGRFTAIFTAGRTTQESIPVMQVAQAGFPVIS